MRELTLNQAATLFSEIPGALHRELKKGATEWIRKVRDTARTEVGFYQPQVGQFPAWAELAESTEDKKHSLGYPPDAPLLATGEMLRSIVDKVSVLSDVDAIHAIAGSDDEKIYYHELGTTLMPPRPVFGPAYIHRREDMFRIVGRSITAGLLNRRR